MMMCYVLTFLSMSKTIFSIVTILFNTVLLRIMMKGEGTVDRTTYRYNVRRTRRSTNILIFIVNPSIHHKYHKSEWNHTILRFFVVPAMTNDRRL